MKNLKLFLYSCLSIFVISACATSYGAKNLTGGLTDTKLSEDTYRVRFEGNGFTSQDKSDEFLLRRCAEITLENGERYFSLSSSESETIESQNSYGVTTFPSGKAIMTIEEDSEDDEKTIMDAVTIVEETNDAAGGKLSDEARKTLQEIKNSK